MRLAGVEESNISYLLTPSRVYCPGQTPLGGAFRTRRFAARRYSREASPSSLWDPNLGSVRCSPKQPTNNTLGAIVGTLLSLTSGRARGIPIHFVSAVKERPPGDQARHNSLLSLELTSCVAV